MLASYLSCCHITLQKYECVKSKLYHFVARVCTDHGKVWKLLEFNVGIFKLLKLIIGVEKSGKILEKCNADLENADVLYAVDYPYIC